MRTPDPIEYMSDVLWHLRDTLRSHKFQEVVTPVARRHEDGTGERVPSSPWRADGAAEHDRSSSAQESCASPACV